MNQPLNDVETEVVVLAKILNHPPSHTAIFELDPLDFDKDVHSIMFKVMKNMYENDIPIGLISVRNELQKQGHGRIVDEFISNYTESWTFSSYSHAEYEINRLKEMSKRRMIWNFSTDATQHAQDLSYSVENIMLDTEKGMNRVSQKNSIEYGTFGDEEVVQGNVDDYLPTGLSAIDKIITGFAPTNFGIIGGRPAHGKSSLALQISKYNCCRGVVLYFSLEMKRIELYQRCLSSYLGLTINQMVSGLNESQKKKFNEAREVLKTNLKNLRIYDKIFKRNDIIREVKRQAVINLPVLVVVDWIQQVEHDEIRDWRQRISYVSSSFKQLAQSTDIPVLAVSHFSRPIKGHEEDEPTLYDLKESGSLENDANLVIFIHKKQHEWFMITAKNRQGGTGKNRVNFEKEYFRFVDYIEKTNFNETLPYVCKRG